MGGGGEGAPVFPGMFLPALWQEPLTEATGAPMCWLWGLGSAVKDLGCCAFICYDFHYDVDCSCETVKTTTMFSSRGLANKVEQYDGM